MSTSCLQKTVIGKFCHSYTLKHSGEVFFYSHFDLTLQSLKERRDMTVLVFASNSSIVLLQPVRVWPLVTYCLPPPSWIMRTTGPAGDQNISLLLTTHKEQENISWHPVTVAAGHTDAPRALFMFFLLWACTCICLDFVLPVPIFLCACVCTYTSYLWSREYVEVWVCSPRQCFLPLLVFSCGFLEKTTKAQTASLRGTGPTLSLSPSPFPFLCFSECLPLWLSPGSLTAVLRARGGKKASSSWTIL